MILKLRYSKQSKKFLDKNKSLLTEKEVETLALESIKKIYNLDDINIDLKPLKGVLKGFYRIRLRNIRIIFNIEKDNENNEIITIFFVKNIDFRGNIYD